MNEDARGWEDAITALIKRTGISRLTAPDIPPEFAVKLKTTLGIKVLVRLQWKCLLF